MNSDKQSYELRLVTLLAMLVMAGAWSWAQRREVDGFRAWANVAGSSQVVAQAPRPSGNLVLLLDSIQPTSRFVLPTRSDRATEPPKTVDGAHKPQKIRLEFLGELQAIAKTSAINVTLNSASQQRARITVWGTAPVGPTYGYAWPTEFAGWNLAVGLVLLLGTALVVERLARRRLRVSLAELLLAVTTATVGIALAQNYWAETRLAERAMAVRVILLAGGYCVLLVAGWGLLGAVRLVVRRRA